MKQFPRLKPFAERWGLASAHDRLQQRTRAELAELKEFYDAVSPQLDDIIQYLNQYPVDGIPDADKPLAYMALALCELDDALHVWQKVNLDYISDPVEWRTKSSFCDYI